MSVFVAYSDEAGVGNSTGEFLMAGYVSKEDEWPWITRAWQQRVLDGPPKLPYLHMRELRNPDWRNTVGISFNDSDERVAEAVRVMYSSGYTSAISAVVKVSDFREVFQKFRGPKVDSWPVDQPDYICFLAYAAFMTAEVYRRYRGEATKVNFVVSKKEIATDHIQEFHGDLKKFLEPPLVDLVGELIPGEMETELPLQAADLLCWHFQRYYGPKRNRMDDGRLALLTLDTSGRIHTWERKDLEQLADALASHDPKASAVK